MRYLASLLLVVTCLTSTYAQEPLLHYSFDRELKGTAVEDSSNDPNDGTLQGGLDYTTNRADGAADGTGKALDFDGTNHYVLLPDNIRNVCSLGEPLTISMWFNADDLTGDQTLFSSDVSGSDRFTIRTAASGTLMGGYYNGSTVVQAASTTGLSEDTWYHLAYVSDGSSAVLYVDGAAVAGTTSPNAFGGSGNARLGMRNAGDQAFDGSIDELRIYNQELSATQVAKLYTDDLESKFVAHYTLDETGSGDVANNEQYPSGWYDPDDDTGNRLSCSVSGWDVSATSHMVYLDFTANRSGSSQYIAAYGFVAPWRFGLSSSGNLFCEHDNSGGGNDNTTLVSAIPDGERVFVAVEMRWLDDEIRVSGSYNATVSADMADSPSSGTGNLSIGKYVNWTTPATDLIIHRVAIENDGVLEQDFDFSKSRTENQVGVRDLTITGSPTFVGGTIESLIPSTDTVDGLAGGTGTALDFDGVDDEIQLEEISAPSDISISFWFNSPDLSNRPRLIQFGKTLIELRTDRVVWWPNYSTTSTIFGVTLEEDQNTYITVTQDTTDAKLYKDGELVDSETVVVPIDTTATVSRIGRFSTSYYEGVLDDVRLYAEALTASEIQEIYQETQVNFELLTAELFGYPAVPIVDRGDLGGILINGVQQTDLEAANVIVFTGDEADAPARMYIQPRADNEDDVRAALKIFGTAHRLEDGTTASNYTDMTLHIDRGEGTNGMGIAALNIKGQGNYAAWNPEWMCGFADLVADSSTLWRGWYYDPDQGFYDAEPWEEGQTVVDDEYMHVSNRIYQADGGGTTGSTAPTHTSGSASDGSITWDFIEEYSSGFRGVMGLVDKPEAPPTGFTNLRFFTSGDMLQYQDRWLRWTTTPSSGAQADQANELGAIGANSSGNIEIEADTSRTIFGDTFIQLVGNRFNAPRITAGDVDEIDVSSGDMHYMINRTANSDCIGFSGASSNDIIIIHNVNALDYIDNSGTPSAGDQLRLPSGDFTAPARSMTMFIRQPSYGWVPIGNY